jgi:hypothetical protein
MGDIAVRRPATLFVVLLAAILLLLAATSMGRATLAAATSGQNGAVPAVINAGTSNHLTITVKAAPIQSDETPKSGKHGKGHGGDGGD